MKAKEIDRRLLEADPASDRRMALLELGPAEAALAEDLVAELAGDGVPGNVAMPWPNAGRGRRFGLVGLVGITAAAVVVAALLLLGGGASDSPSRAYGAELVRFAESSPLLLLEQPGWRIQDVYEEKTREGTEGSMTFVAGKAIPSESIKVTGNVETGQYETGMTPAAVRQRKVELTWSHRGLEETVAFARGSYQAHGRRWTKAPVLGTRADVDMRDEVFVNQGGPGDRQMTAYWSEDGYLLELRAAVPDLAAFEERLDWLTKVDSETWLEAMPAKVVKAADHDAAVREMLKGVPLPDDFRPSLVPDAGLTTNRDQVASAVTNTVSCLWFRQWGAARRSGDNGAKAEAERAMSSFRQWPILRKIAKEGEYPETLVKLVASMPSGVWQFGPHRWRLLPKAEGLGCARYGIPVLPWKQKRQRERGGSPLPR